MRRSAYQVFLACVVLGGSVCGQAQQYVPPPPPPPPVYLAPAVSGLMMQLTDQPATRSAFSLDRAIAQGILQSAGMDAARAAAAITSVSVENYRYPHPAFYTPEAMAALIEGYRAAGWKHLVNANQTPANTAQPKAMVTDLWLHFSGTDIDGVTVLTRSSQMMNVLHLTGDLRPLDLLHLSGHFGIPKVDPGAVMVPAP